MLLDDTKNGGMTPTQLEDHLVMTRSFAWAWDPSTDPQGRRRQPPPVPRAEFVQAVKEWLRLGTPCPRIYPMYFLCGLIAPGPSFAMDMKPPEDKAMNEHVATGPIFSQKGTSAPLAG